MLRIVLIMVMFGILIAGGVLLFQFASRDKGVVKSAQDKVAEITNPIQSPFNRLVEKEKMILITDSGFVPETLDAWPFDQIYWINQTNESVVIEELPDEQTNNPTLNLGNISPGQSKSTYFAYRGRYRYYDRNHPERTGFLNIE